MSEVYINSIAKGTTTVSEFGGLNLKPSCGFNEFSYMKNMTSDNYPLLSTREARKYGATFTIPFCYFKAAAVSQYITHPYGFDLTVWERDDITGKIDTMKSEGNLYAIITKGATQDIFEKIEVAGVAGDSNNPMTWYRGSEMYNFYEDPETGPPYISLWGATIRFKFPNNDIDLIRQTEKELNLYPLSDSSGGASGSKYLSYADRLTLQIFGEPQSNTIITDDYIYYIRAKALCRKSVKAMSEEEILIENKFSGKQQIQLSGQNIVITPSLAVYDTKNKTVYGENYNITILFDDVKIECDPADRAPNYRFIIKCPYPLTAEEMPTVVFKTSNTLKNKEYRLDMLEYQEDDNSLVSKKFSKLDIKDSDREVWDFIDKCVITKTKDGVRFTAELNKKAFNTGGIIGEFDGFTADLGIEFKFVIPYNNRLFACDTKGNCTYSSVIGKLYDFVTLEDGEASADWIEVNSNGVFTAIAAFGGNVYYFKENCVHKLYGSSPSDWQLVMLPINGVEEGAYGSLAVENDICIYKSTDGFYYFDGASSVKISDNLGVWSSQMTANGEDIPLSDAEYSACIFKGKYYCIAYDYRNNISTLYTYDIQRGIWCCEESCDSIPDGGKIMLELTRTSRAVYGAFLTYGGDYHADHKDIRFIPLCGRNEFYKDGYTYESIFDWCVISGRLTLSVPNIKEINKIQIRAEGSEWTSVKATLIADENGNEIASYEFEPRKLNTFQFPLKPLRCDNVKLKLEGQGFCIIHSITLSVSERTEYR